MSIKNRILVPTDFSDNAWKALTFAAHLQNHLEDFELIVLHSFLPFYTGFQSPQENQAQYDTAFEISKQRMDSLEANIKQDFPHLNYQIVIKDGTLHNSITDLRDEYTLKAIVMGTKGASGLQANLIGSQTFEVGKRTDLPLIIIPEQYQFQPTYEVVYLTNFEKNDQDSIDLMNVLLRPQHIHFVHFADVDQSASLKKSLEEHIGSLNIKNSSYDLAIYNIRDFENEKSIQAKIQELGWSLITINPVQRGFFENLFTKSFSKPLIHSSQIPILLAKTS